MRPTLRNLIMANSGRSFNPLQLPNLWAWYRRGVGVTAASDRLSNWTDASGRAHDVLQATAGAQPIYLPNFGTNYLWLPGVSGNYASTPDAAANSITGDLKLRFAMRLPDYTPSARMTLASKYLGTGNQRAWAVYLNTAGTVRIQWYPDGSATNVAAITSVALPFADGTLGYFELRVDVDNGASGNTTTFYTSTDDITYTQLGTVTTNAVVSNIFDSTAPIEIGTYDTGTSEPVIGDIRRFQMFNSLAATTPVVDFNAATALEGASTVLGSTGETWTINSTGAKRAQIVGRPWTVFDGVAQYMQSAAATLNQPVTIIDALIQPAWTSGRYISDGLSANSGALTKTTSTPRVSINAGSAVAENTGLVLNTGVVVAHCLNGASSYIQVNNNTRTTGNAGAGNPGGITIGANGVGASFGSVQLAERIVVAGVLDDATLYRAMVYVGKQIGVTL
jgi:hypothetical protein